MITEMEPKTPDGPHSSEPEEGELFILTMFRFGCFHVTKCYNIFKWTFLVILTSITFINFYKKCLQVYFIQQL